MGNDWSVGRHDVYLMDEEGARLGLCRLGEGLGGVARLHEMVAEHASDAAEVVVGIEADRWSVGRRAHRSRLSGVCDQPYGGFPVGDPVTAKTERNPTGETPRC